jgi:hypothetical protein
MYLSPERLHRQKLKYKRQYSHIPPSQFAGKYGGAYWGSYPIPDSNHAIRALIYARHAPNPQGIRDHVLKVAKRKGWLNPKTGSIRRNLQ